MKVLSFFSIALLGLFAFPRVAWAEAPAVAVDGATTANVASKWRHKLLILSTASVLARDKGRTRWVKDFARTLLESITAVDPKLRGAAARDGFAIGPWPLYTNEDVRERYEEQLAEENLKVAPPVRLDGLYLAFTAKETARLAEWIAAQGEKVRGTNVGGYADTFAKEAAVWAEEAERARHRWARQGE